MALGIVLVASPLTAATGVTTPPLMSGFVDVNVALHGPEIARAAGLDLWADVSSQQEFNQLSRDLPVLVNMRPFGAYSMVDVEKIGGVPVIVKELLTAGALDGSALTCTGETLAEQIARIDPPAPQHASTERLPVSEAGPQQYLPRSARIIMPHDDVEKSQVGYSWTVGRR